MSLIIHREIKLCMVDGGEIGDTLYQPLSQQSLDSQVCTKGVYCVPGKRIPDFSPLNSDKSNMGSLHPHLTLFSMGRVLHAPASCGFCPLLKIYLGNPYLKILDLSKLFCCGCPCEKKSKQLV